MIRSLSRGFWLRLAEALAGMGADEELEGLEELEELEELAEELAELLRARTGDSA